MAPGRWRCREVERALKGALDSASSDNTVHVLDCGGGSRPRWGPTEQGSQVSIWAIVACSIPYSIMGLLMQPISIVELLIKRSTDVESAMEGDLVLSAIALGSLAVVGLLL